MANILPATKIDNALAKVAKKTNPIGSDGLIKELIHPDSKSVNNFDFDTIEIDKIFHISHIKKVCIDYRLRFLDLAYFKGNIPPKVIQNICELEKLHGTTLNNFKIMAPSVLFRLKKADDPLLFVPMGNDYFYLVDKWGNDLSPLRKIMVWPLKNLRNLILATVVVSLVITSLTPFRIFTTVPDYTTFWMIFLFMFKAIASVVLFIGFSSGKNFNPAIWNNRYDKTR